MSDEHVETAVVVIGAPGSGKSAALEALSDLVADDGIEHAALELEQLGRGHPWLSIGDTLPQLSAVLAAQRRLGRRRFLIAATTETDAELEALVGALRADRTIVACLRASAETAAARVLDREPPHWSGRQALVAKARYLAGVIPGLRAVDVRIDTDDQEAIEVARALRTVLRERGLLPGG